MPEPKPRLRAAPETADPRYFGRDPGAVLLIFLDFDGVLHPLGPHATRFEHAPIFLRALDALRLQGATPSLALSTSWRFFDPALIESELDRAAPGLGSYLEGRCGKSTRGAGSRVTEIGAYLDQRPFAAPCAIAALDDQIALYGSPSPDWLVPIDGTKGLDDSILQCLLERLERPSPF